MDYYIGPIDDEEDELQSLQDLDPSVNRIDFDSIELSQVSCLTTLVTNALDDSIPSFADFGFLGTFLLASNTRQLKSFPIMGTEWGSEGVPLLRERIREMLRSHRLIGPP